MLFCQRDSATYCPVPCTIVAVAEKVETEVDRVAEKVETEVDREVALVSEEPEDSEVVPLPVTVTIWVTPSCFAV